jgi:short-subunit dehydrogenase
LLARGIFVSLVLPGLTATAVWDKGYEVADQMMGGLPAHAKELYVDAYHLGRKFMDRGRRNAVPPEIVAKAVLHAMESRRPKPRYVIGTETRVIALADRFLPPRLLDWFVRKVLSK